MESIPDFPNKFVGPEKCGQCHPAQYETWKRSRHAKVVRFPNEIEDFGNDLKDTVYPQSPLLILLKGMFAYNACAVIGTPRTKYGFIDKWLVRGTCHIEGDKLGDGTGKMVVGGNQFSRLCSESVIPEMAKKIAAFAFGFPAKMEEFGGSFLAAHGMDNLNMKGREKEKKYPTCWDCHAVYSTVENVVWSMKQKSDKKCGSCYEDQQDRYYETFHEKAMYLNIAVGVPTVAACYDCHGKHNIYKMDDPLSTLSSENRIKTCNECHKNSNENFVSFIAHADHTNKTDYPHLYYTYIFITCLIYLYSRSSVYILSYGR